MARRETFVQRLVPCIALCISVLLLALPATEAQHACVKYTGDVCRGLFSTDVSIPAGKTLSMLENSLFIYRKRALAVSFMYPDCYQSMLAFLCTFTFSPCSNDTLVPLPTPPCNSMCTDVERICPSFIAEELGLTCDIFPNEMTTYPVPMACSVQNAAMISLGPCPDEDKLDRHPDTHVCTLKCDYDYYTPSQASPQIIFQI